MSQLLLLLLLGSGLLIIFIRLLVGGRRSETELPITAVILPRAVSLPGLNFGHPDLLFDDRDFNTLRCAPALRVVAKQLAKDRRRLVLVWLSLMQRDVLTLWRFRRFLSACGFTTTLDMELRIAIDAILILSQLTLIRTFVWLFGPFPFRGTLRGVLRAGEHSRQACAQLLANISPLRLLEIEQRWLVSRAEKTA